MFVREPDVRGTPEGPGDGPPGADDDGPSDRGGPEVPVRDVARPASRGWRRAGLVAGLLAGVGLGALLWDLARCRRSADSPGPWDLLKDLNRYRFRTVWHVDAQPADVFQAVDHVENYPQWWPEVKRVSLNGKLHPQTVIRGFLPYSLKLAMEQVHIDRREGVLEARLAGDLKGRSQWTVSAAAAGSDLLFEEDVELGKMWMRVLAPPLRPLLRANHALMMRHGQRGLVTYLHRPDPAPPSLLAARTPVARLVRSMALIFGLQGEVKQGSAAG